VSTNKPESRENRRAARERMAAERAAQQAADQRRERVVRIGIIVGVLALVVGVTALVWWNNRLADQFPRPAGSNDAGGIAVGTGPVDVTIWEDFQCPACKLFEDSTGDTVTELIDSDQITATYFPLSFLDANLGNDSSTRAANAAGCASDAGKFKEFHDIVYANQPETEGTGYTDEQLKDFGAQAGIEGDAKATFDTCVDELTYSEWVRLVSKSGRDAGITSTPTVQVNGEELARENYTPEGLKKAVAAAAQG
jgi:protein-disulfide isomerase